MEVYDKTNDEVIPIERGYMDEHAEILEAIARVERKLDVLLRIEQVEAPTRYREAYNLKYKEGSK